MPIPASLVKSLRESTGAGIMDCKNALVQCNGDIDKASNILREKGLAKAGKRAGRDTSQGLIEVYTHPGGRLGAMIELNCESDFVARTEEFKKLAHDLVLQVTATAPVCINSEDLPKDSAYEAKDACLILQDYVKDPSKTIQDIITEAIAKTGENIKIRRFTRFELGT
ncbi:MAG: translation elongation factor Ts [Dehalococcoidia bacterium]|nr:translation elongation factor Ts [Dehalococcoidia bacterium]